MVPVSYASMRRNVREMEDNLVYCLDIMGGNTRYAYGRGNIYIRGVSVAAQSLNLQTNLTIGVVSTGQEGFWTQKRPHKHATFLYFMWCRRKDSNLHAVARTRP